MIKSTYEPEISNKRIEILIEILKEFEVAYNLSWKKMILAEKKIVLRQLLTLIQIKMKLGLIIDEKSVEQKQDKIH